MHALKAKNSFSHYVHAVLRVFVVVLRVFENYFVNTKHSFKEQLANAI